jgi:hypothetical protein
MQESHLIVGIHITNRVQNASEVQKLFTQYGCNIKTRIGLHHVDDNVCSPHGLILLELFGDPKLCQELVTKVGQVHGVDVQTMKFDHPVA